MEENVLHSDQNKMDIVYSKVKQLIKIVNELEKEFVGRKFTLDGHLVGSIGEVLAAYYYGLELLPPSAKTHDAISQDGKSIQIKITQAASVLITSEPEYLIVLFLDKENGDVYEVYNGPGEEPWKSSYLYEKHNTNYMRLSSLLQLDCQVDEKDRISQINKLPKYNKMNKDTLNVNADKNSKKKGSYSTVTGFINTKNQMNLGKTTMKGTDHGQWFYQMKCLSCDHQYLANGSNISAVKCPKCK